VAVRQLGGDLVDDADDGAPQVSGASPESRRSGRRGACRSLRRYRAFGATVGPSVLPRQVAVL
jgi:hypothetical protein